MISRRSLLQHGATATVLTGIAVATVQCTPTEAPAAELASPAILDAIARHRIAAANWLAMLNEEARDDEAQYAALNKAKEAGADDAQCKSIRNAWKNSSHAFALEKRLRLTSRAENKTLEALVDLPVATIADLRAKLGYLDGLNADEYLSMIDDAPSRLIRSILGGGLV